MKYSHIILCILCLVIGFFVGRKTVSYEEDVKYIQGEAIYGSIPASHLEVQEVIPENPVLPMKTDTTYIDRVEYIVQKVDTAAIIADYITLRDYAYVLLDSPTQGKLSLSTTVQYNKLSALNWEFSPVIREVTKSRIKVLQFYTGISYSTFNQTTVSGGLFYFDAALEFQYIYDLTHHTTGQGIGFKYKF
ncbi:MAG: hypothetical protein LBJ72_12805 [Dysgonamonadaceae bacterium]|jgi:hypothetical protein|nr:hypothetical protein [Dysgonamonadaceae bacterium]